MNINKLTDYGLRLHLIFTNPFSSAGESGALCFSETNVATYQRDPLLATLPRAEWQTVSYDLTCLATSERMKERTQLGSQGAMNLTVFKVILTDANNVQGSLQTCQ